MLGFEEIDVRLWYSLTKLTSNSQAAAAAAAEVGSVVETGAGEEP